MGTGASLSRRLRLCAGRCRVRSPLRIAHRHHSFPPDGAVVRPTPPGWLPGDLLTVAGIQVTFGEEAVAGHLGLPAPLRAAAPGPG